MCVSLSDNATLFDFPDDFQALAEGSGPGTWSKGCPGVVGTSRFFGVRYSRWSYEHYLDSF